MKNRFKNKKEKNKRKVIFQKKINENVEYDENNSHISPKRQKELLATLKEIEEGRAYIYKRNE